MSIPSDIASFHQVLNKVMKIGKSRNWEIYVTNKRVIFRKEIGGGVFGKEIVEAPYRHISSIEYKKESPWGWDVKIHIVGRNPLVIPCASGELEEIIKIIGQYRESSYEGKKKLRKRKSL